MRPLPPRGLRRLCFMAGVAAVFGAASADAQEGTTSPPWRLDLTAGVGYDDNIRFTPSMESAVSGRLGAGLTRLMRSSRANLTLGASGEGSAYRESPEFNRINYSANLSASYLISPRSTVRIGDSFSKGYTGGSPLLIDAGLFFPRTVSSTNDASIEASHQISRRWNWTVSARHRVAYFDSTLLNDGSSFIGRADLSWTSAPESPIGLYYEFGRMSPGGRPSFNLHGATLRTGRRFGEKFSAHLELGARTLISQRTESSRVVPTGAAGFAVRSGKQTIEAGAFRSVSEAFGLGRLQVRSAASLRFARTLTSRVALGLNANLSRSRDPSGGAGLSFVTGVLDGDLKFRLAKDVEFSAAGGYRRLDPIATAHTHSRFLSLSLRVGQNW